MIDVLKELQRGLSTAHRAQRAARREFLTARFEFRLVHRLLRNIGEDHDTHAIKAAQRHITHRRGDLPGEIKLARLAKRHRFAGVEKEGDRQFAFLLVEFQEQPIQPAVEVPVQIAKIVPGDIIAVIGELDRLAARLAASFAFERTLRAPLREQLELFESAEEFWGEKSGHDSARGSRMEDVGWMATGKTPQRSCRNTQRFAEGEQRE